MYKYVPIQFKSINDILQNYVTFVKHNLIQFLQAVTFNSPCNNLTPEV